MTLAYMFAHVLWTHMLWTRVPAVSSSAAVRGGWHRAVKLGLDAISELGP